MQQERLLTIREVSRWLNLHPNTIRTMTNTGELACIRVGKGHRRFRASDIEAYLERNSNNHNS